MIMDDISPTHERRKLVKTYKICSLENSRLWLLRTTKKMIKRRRIGLQGNAEREKERERV